MFDQQIINDINAKINALIPDELKQACGDIDKNIKAVLQGALAKIDMVPREEFDAQCKVLARTRQKLEMLEQQIERINEQLAQQKGS